MTTYVIGDVHGCLDELDELLAWIAPRPGRDRLVFLGDLMDRGPDPAGVVRRVRELGAECVLGNHDEKHVRWARHQAKAADDPGYRNPMKSMPPERIAEHAELSDDDRAWLAARPHTLRLDQRWWALHGGAVPRRRLDRQHPAQLLRLRYLDEAGAMISSAHCPPGGRHWATAWPGPESILYGHHVHSLEHPRIDHPVPGVVCAGIDTGCVFGGHLTAYLLDTGDLLQVAARRAYAPLLEEEDA